MPETIDRSELGSLYEWLSRFNLLNNLLRFGRLDADLTIHKSLRLPEALQRRVHRGRGASIHP